MDTTQKRERKNNNVKFDISLSEEQKQAKEGIFNHPFSFIIGKAGSGKTLVAVATALDMVFKGNVNKLVITRPTVSTEDNGFLPGTLQEKMEPWLIPIKSNINKVYNHPEKIKKMIEEGQIELVALTHFRGRTFENAICIVDEFQNLSKSQLSMVLSRLGKNSYMVLTGDFDQIDLKFKNESAIHLVTKLETSKYVSVSVLKENHRHPALDDVLNMLNNADEIIEERKPKLYVGPINE